MSVTNTTATPRLDANTSMTGDNINRTPASDSGSSPRTSISQFRSDRSAPPSYSSFAPGQPLATVRYSIPRPDSLVCPPGNIHWYYVITRGQEVGIFSDWYVFYLDISTLFEMMNYI